jgi:hypothetical protein
MKNKRSHSLVSGFLRAQQHEEQEFKIPASILL